MRSLLVSNPGQNSVFSFDQVSGEAQQSPYISRNRLCLLRGSCLRSHPIVFQFFKCGLTRVHKALAKNFFQMSSDSISSCSSIVETVKCLGLHSDKRLTWKNHVATKRKQLDLKTREIYWLIGKHSPLSMANKLLIYKTVLKPVWTYGLELWGCASKSNIAVIQRYRSKLLRSITNAPWYVSNHTLHSDLHIPYVHTVFRERTATHRTALDSHPNPLLEPLVHPPNNTRLERRWTSDEIH